MNQLITKILELQELSKELEPTEERRNELNSALCSYSNDFINTLKSHPAFVNDQNEKDKINLDKGKQSFIDFLNEFDQEVHQKGIKPASGGHVGYIPGGGIFTAALGDYLACISNEYAGMHYASPGAVTIENELLDWMKSLFGFPKNAVGNLTSGGSIANMIALTAARDKYGVKNENITKSVIYLSEQVHHCVLKALRIIGLEDVCIRYLKLDAYHKIDTAYLEKVILKDKNKGLCPFLVIASAGTTDTGAIDPLDEIAQLSEKHNLWYHIDGAYGGFFMLCESKKPLFKGIEKADSLVIDPHKGLFLPYGIGAVLIKDREIVYKSHHYTANYMQDAIHEKRDNPADVSPELTKHFRGLRMWIPFKIHGIEPFTACLNEKLLLTTYFRNKLGQMDFKLGPEPDLSVSYFWYEPEGEDTNKFNKRLLEHLHTDGTVFLSSTMLGEHFVIRLAIGSFRTKLETIDLAIDMLKSCLQLTKKEFGIN